MTNSFSAVTAKLQIDRHTIFKTYIRDANVTNLVSISQIQLATCVEIMANKTVSITCCTSNVLEGHRLVHVAACSCIVN